MRRILKAPRHPDILGRLTAALRVFAGQRTPRNAMERGVHEALVGRQIKAGVARRVVAAFDAIPQPTRTRLLGDAGDARFVGARSVVVPSTAPTTVPVPLERLLDRQGSGGLTRFPDAPPAVKYQVRYQGFCCENESDWDRGSGSDEIYFVTSAVSGPANVVRTIRHPLGHEKHYGDVDTDEVREGPVAVVWEGNADVVSLVVTAFERDEGDPDAYRDEVDVLVKATIALLTKLYPPAALAALFNETIVDAINWLLGTGDDPIAVQTVVLPRSLLEMYAGSNRGPYVAQVWRPRIQRGQIVWGFAPVVTNLLQHFSTVHAGGGGKYVACFDVEREPPLPGPVIL